MFCGYKYGELKAILSKPAGRQKLLEPIPAPIFEFKIFQCKGFMNISKVLKG